jgi:hypothetical protein
MGKPINEIQTAALSIMRARTRVIEDARSLSGEKASFKPSPDVWSVQEILEHLYLWDSWVLTMIRRLKGELSLQMRITVEYPNRNRTFEEIIAPLISKRVVTPKAMAPSDTATAEFWIQGLQANQKIVNELPALLSGTDPDSIVFPHFVAGPLNALQWLDFLTFHLEKHHKQMRCWHLERNHDAG